MSDSWNKGRFGCGAVRIFVLFVVRVGICFNRVRLAWYADLFGMFFYGALYLRAARGFCLGRVTRRADFVWGP